MTAPSCGWGSSLGPTWIITPNWACRFSENLTTVILQKLLKSWGKIAPRDRPMVIPKQRSEVHRETDRAAGVVHGGKAMSASP